MATASAPDPALVERYVTAIRDLHSSRADAFALDLVREIVSPDSRYWTDVQKLDQVRAVLAAVDLVRTESRR